MALQKIKILHLIKSLGRGGAEMLLPETLKLHDQHKFEFHYIYFLPWKDEMTEALVSAGGTVKCFAASNNIKILLKATAVIKYCEVNKIDLIHCHLPWAGFLGRLVYKKTSIPVIYTEHNKQERYHRLTYLINKFTFNWQTLAIAVSGDVGVSIQRNIRPAIPIVEVLNGVNVDIFRRNSEEGTRIRKELGIPENGIVVGTVAVFRFQKRLEQWLEVMKVICDKHKNVYGIIVGDGPLKEKIIAKKKELNLENKVAMPGLIKDVKPWLSAIDIYMMSSLYEGLPVALLEAMSMECAVASTKAGGIGELVRDKIDGLLTTVESWSDLSLLIEVLLVDRPKRLMFGRQARNRVGESFSLKSMIEKLETIYIKETSSGGQQHGN